MIVRDGAGLGTILRFMFLKNWPLIILILLVALFVGENYNELPVFETTVFSSNAVAMLATVVGIFLVFRFNNAYERWWEARILWGGLVNASRNWGRQVTTLLTPERLGHVIDAAELDVLRRALVQRQLAVINALRLRLRDQLDNPEARTCLGAFVEQDELDAVLTAPNPATALLANQSKTINRFFANETAPTVLLAEFQNTLNDITNIQGGCERIKTTAFPDSVTYISKSLVTVLALLIPAVFLEPNEVIYPLELAVVLFISLAFVVVYQLALELMHPFDNGRNDTPMSTLCNTIERDLLTMLGDADIPDQLQPVKGVLM